MNIKPESLIKAAKQLQRHCRSVDPCDENSNCLFYDRESGHCLIKTFPINWDLDKIQERIDNAQPQRAFDVDVIVDKLLDYFGLDHSGNRVHELLGEKLFALPGVTVVEARQVQTRVNRMLSSVNQCCKMTYVKKDDAAYFDIVNRELRWKYV